MKRKGALFLGFLSILSVAIFYWESSRLPNNHGGVDYQLFLSQRPGKSPLVVGLGGSEGGMIYAAHETRALRDSLNHLGYHFLAVGYFGTANSPDALDRISLNAIYDTIKSVSNHAAIDQEAIIVLGGSRGAELGLTSQVVIKMSLVLSRWFQLM